MTHDPPKTGTITDAYITETAGAAMRRVDAVMALAGVGLEGDRYAKGVGTFSRWPGEGRSLTIIAAEAIEAVRLEFGIDLSAGRHRRNLVIVGVDLPSLKERRFCIGGALLRGSRVAQPCRYLERLLGGDKVYDALKGRGGLRAEILESGVIRVGDAVEPA